MARALSQRGNAEPAGCRDDHGESCKRELEAGGLTELRVELTAGIGPALRRERLLDHTTAAQGVPEVRLLVGIPGP